MTEQRKFTVKTRYVWFTLADWQAFSDALAEAYPQARYDFRPAYDVGQDRPEIVWENRIADIPFSRKGASSWAGDIPMIFDPDWQPTSTRYIPLYNEPPDTMRWGIAQTPRTPLPFVKFQDRVGPDTNELATITTFRESHIHYFCLADNKPAAAEMRRYFRLLDKFCTNRNQAYYRLPSFELIRTEAKGSWYWFGHDAIRWVREDSRRSLNYAGSTSWAMRPCTEEEMVALPAQRPPVQES
ncbi:hypothetical protein FNB15_07040 [Ferrovibrio terrae]|uniref:Uncharacterized protein n=1 Tax=Ferrovibrio terrae TaxID=2594003 RepID=A0A516GZU4_9PROT|nr:hypothetical protein [Ferrovibrio terrae]QDO97043.1 hypothetical protein FNB15_07040 [Ferrovibrio terrae]